MTMSRLDNYPGKLVNRINNEKIIEQKYYSFIKELNSFSEEQLDSEALICGRKILTYREMFDEWDKFAEVFSALGITYKNKSRIGLMTSHSTDCINMLYASDITGASVSMIQAMDMLDHERYKNAIEKEGITDLLLTSDCVKPDLLRYIMDTRDTLSIKNVIVYYPFKDRDPGAVRDDVQYNRLKRVNGVLFIDDLVRKYKGSEIVRDSNKSREAAVIFHTSGTTSGIHKPIPLSDKAYNESAARLLRDERFNNLNSYRVFMSMEPFTAYAACDMLHLPLAYGGTVIMPSSSDTGLSVLNMIAEQKISIILAGRFIFEAMLKMPLRPDLSSVELVILGGSYVSPDKKRRFYEYLKRCGSDARIYVGYGLTETGGAVFLTESGTDYDELGNALLGVKVKIFDENKGIYRDPEDGAQTGALCLSTKSLSSGKLNGLSMFELEEIDGEKYLNTYDLVDVDANGHIRIIGRMNKFFVNNDGIRFDAGLVETAVASKPGIEDCGLVPFFNKVIHDTLPALYVIPDDKGSGGVRAVRDALVSVFITDGKFADSNLPSKVIITSRLPYTETGKVDVHAILKNPGLYEREAYGVRAIKKGDHLADIKLIRSDKKSPFIEGVPEELEHDAETIIKNGPMGGRFAQEIYRGGLGGDPERMIAELIRSGSIEPEMLGAMIARMLKESCAERRTGRRGLDYYYMGLDGLFDRNEREREDDD